MTRQTQTLLTADIHLPKNKHPLVLVFFSFGHRRHDGF